MSITYKIGEAAELLNLKTYVLRFWETEFPDIAPLRTEKGQRLYAGEHLALLERIRFLLHERGLTIEGARRVLAEEKKRGVSYRFNQGEETKTSPPPNQPPVYWPGEKAPDGRTVPCVTPAAPSPGPAAREPITAAVPLPQHNLPGIVQSAPRVADSLDRASRTEYCLNEREEAARASLPLFGLGKAAGLPGRLTDKAMANDVPETPQGGDNFLAAGLEGAAGAHFPGFASSPAQPPSGKREFLRDLAVELERIAALLHPEK